MTISGDSALLLATVGITTVVWIIVTYLTEPTERSVLVNFYRLTRPAGPGWKSIQAEAGVGPSPDSLSLSLLGWVAGCSFVYSALFGAGSWLYGRNTQAVIWAAVFVVSGIILIAVLRRMWAEPTPDMTNTPAPADTKT